MFGYCVCLSTFFFNDTATTEIYTLSLHDALPISRPRTHTTRSWCRHAISVAGTRSEEHTSELQSPVHLVCRLLLEKKKKNLIYNIKNKKIYKIKKIKNNKFYYFLYLIYFIFFFLKLIFTIYFYFFFFFFFNDTATTEIYTLSLHDALPIFGLGAEDLPGVIEAVGR